MKSSHAKQNLRTAAFLFIFNSGYSVNVSKK